MPTITTVDATWTNGMAMDEAELRRADTTMFIGDGSANGVRGGVVRHGDTSLAVSVNGSDQVTVQPGAAVIPAATGLGAYRASLPAATAATGLASRNATNPRIDLVVMQIVAGAAVVKTVDGTPGSSPSAPALPASSVELARVTVPAVGGGAVTVDSTWRAYATGLGGTLCVETAARLPGSGNQKGQRAVALDSGVVYTWSGTAWGAKPWVAYTPTWQASTVNPAVGNGSIVGEYFTEGLSTTHYRIKLTFGSTTNGGSGFYIFGLPVSSGWVSDDPMGTAVCRDAGVSALPRTALQFSTGGIYLSDAAGVMVNGTAPFVFGAGDSISITGTYKRA